jgi:hypothetical protein
MLNAGGRMQGNLRGRKCGVRNGRKKAQRTHSTSSETPSPLRVAPREDSKMEHSFGSDGRGGRILRRRSHSRVKLEHRAVGAGEKSSHKEATARFPPDSSAYASPRKGWTSSGGSSRSEMIRDVKERRQAISRSLCQWVAMPTDGLMSMQNGCKRLRVDAGAVLLQIRACASTAALSGVLRLREGCLRQDPPSPRLWRDRAFGPEAAGVETVRDDG